MVTRDRIRLTGLLRKKPWKRGFFYGPDSPATRQARPAAGLTAVSVEPLGAVARRGLAGRAGYEPLRPHTVHERSNAFPSRCSARSRTSGVVHRVVVTTYALAAVFEAAWRQHADFPRDTSRRHLSALRCVRRGDGLGGNRPRRASRSSPLSRRWGVDRVNLSPVPRRDTPYRAPSRNAARAGGAG